MLIFVPPKTCCVKFVDQHGVEHEVVVQAGTVFEAAALALRSFRGEDWSAEGSHWTGALHIEVKTAPVRHTVMLEKFHRFLESDGGSPADRTRRETLRQILDGK